MRDESAGVKALDQPRWRFEYSVSQPTLNPGSHFELGHTVDQKSVFTELHALAGI